MAQKNNKTINQNVLNLGDQGSSSWRCDLCKINLEYSMGKTSLEPVRMSVQGPEVSADSNSFMFCGPCHKDREDEIDSHLHAYVRSVTSENDEMPKCKPHHLISGKGLKNYKVFRSERSNNNGERIYILSKIDQNNQIFSVVTKKCGKQDVILYLNNNGQSKAEYDKSIKLLENYMKDEFGGFVEK